MLTGIDHLVVACADPDEAALRLENRLGLRAGGGGRHEALGTFNRLVWLGDSYLELIGVWDRDVARESWLGRPTIRALDAGGGLATWAVASDDLASDVATLRAHGSDLADPQPGERLRPDGRLVRWSLAAPPALGPADPPFLIEHDPSGAEWTPDERAARAAEVHPGGRLRLQLLELEVPDVARASLRFLRSAGIGPFRPSLAGGGARDADVGGQTVRLRPAPAGRAARATIRLMASGELACAGRDEELLGCRWVIAT
jgi:hypothetical protein